MTSNYLANSFMTIEAGMAIIKPAEFIILRIKIKSLPLTE